MSKRFFRDINAKKFNFANHMTFRCVFTILYANISIQ